MKIEHVALYVEDLEKSKAFFEHYFKAQSGAQYHNKKTNFRSYFLTFEGGARLEIMTRDDLELQAKPHTRTGFAHIAFSLGSKEKVDSLTEQLVLDGYECISCPRTTGDGYYESCILDSEGNQIELTV